MSKSRLLGGASALLAMLLCLAAIAPAQVPTVNDFNQLGWRWVGPVTFSGRITEFAVPRGQATTWYALAGSGGLWKTVDAGISFEPIFDKYGNMSMGYLAIAPSNPDILYLGTGESMHARSSSRGNGVWKSTDAGKTWTNVGLPKSYFINKVAIDPKNPDVVYVAAEGKLYDNEMDCERGFYKTTDGGKTWTRMGILPDRGISDFVVDPTNFDVIIAGAYKFYRRAWTYIDRQAGNDLYKSTDGGKTWTKLTEGLPVGKELGKAGLTIYEKNPKIVYARLDEEMNLGLNLRENAANFNQRTGFYREGGSIAKWKSYKLKPEIVQGSQMDPTRGRKRPGPLDQVERPRPGQGVPDEERDRPGETRGRSPESLCQRQGPDRSDRCSSRSPKRSPNPTRPRGAIRSATASPWR